MKRRSQRGQGLVEYALILVLVAIVAIVILGVLGYVTQGGFGLVLGGLQSPGRAVASSSHLTFLSVQCKPGVNIHVQFSTDLPLTELSLRNDAPDWYWTGYPTSTDFTMGIPGLSCPRSVVIQHQKSGAISAAGVETIP